MRRNAKGRFVKGSSSKHKRRRNPRPKSSGKRRAGTGYVVGTAKIRRRKMNPSRRHHALKRHRNPRFSIGGIGGQLKAGLVGASGGLANALIMGFITPKLPASISTGYPLHGVRIASALAVGALGRKFAGRYGAQLGEGAMIVAVYLLLKDVATATVPSLPLGDYQEIELSHPASVLGGVGAYMNGLPAPRGGDVGAYMDGLTTQDAVMEY